MGSDDGAEPARKYDMPLWCSVASGTVGGTCAVLVGYPFETVKVRLQTGTTKALFRHLFAGVSAPLLTVTPQWAIMYGAYYSAQRWLDSQNLYDFGPAGRGAVSGAICGLSVSLCAVPVDVVKINAQKMHCSAWDACRRLLSARGPGFVLHGAFATALHLTLSQAAFFAAYETVLSRWSAADAGTPEYAPAVAGGVAGVLEWSLFMSTDTVKTRVQASDVRLSYFSAWRSVLAAEGPRGLYRGYLPVILRAVPVNASSFFVIELANDRIRRWREERSAAAAAMTLRPRGDADLS